MFISLNFARLTQFLGSFVFSNAADKQTDKQTNRRTRKRYDKVMNVHLMVCNSVRVYVCIKHCIQRRSLASLGRHPWSVTPLFSLSILDPSVYRPTNSPPGAVPGDE